VRPSKSRLRAVPKTKAPRCSTWEWDWPAATSEMIHLLEPTRTRQLQRGPIDGRLRLNAAKRRSERPPGPGGTMAGAAGHGIATPVEPLRSSPRGMRLCARGGRHPWHPHDKLHARTSTTHCVRGTRPRLHVHVSTSARGRWPLSTPPFPTHVAKDARRAQQQPPCCPPPPRFWAGMIGCTPSIDGAGRSGSYLPASRFFRTMR